MRRCAIMERYELLIIGAGPAGLSAAIEAAEKGMKVCIFDENAKPGGQLFKQIHKFFGSKEHMAKTRGFRIGKLLLDQAEELQVKVYLEAQVLGIYENHVLSVRIGDQIETFRGDHIIIATGAAEKMIPFTGWTLPGVIGAGAAQTMMNLHGVMPGSKVLMVGSGNVGLVVSYQLMQAGCEVAAVIDAAPKIGGYGVHAAKTARLGVPFYMSHTVIKAEGNERVEKVTIGKVDETWQIIPGTEKEFDVDTICIAVGLNPMAQLAKMAGCEMEDRGGLVPVCDEFGETSIEGIFAAGDVAGIEEASSAMITGRIAANAALAKSGYITEDGKMVRHTELKNSLEQLRQGMFVKANRGKVITETEEGYPLSESLRIQGYVTKKDLENFPGAASHCGEGVHPVIECTQNIPCNPCGDACRFGCIKIGGTISGIPAIDRDKTCTGCGMCVASCPGQAIFLVNENYEPGSAAVSMPYEMLPAPEKGDVGAGLDRSGKKVCDAEVVEVRSAKSYDKTTVLTVKIPAEMADQVRGYRGICR